jgi:hypothetical protein
MTEINFVDKQAGIAALKDVRDNTTPTNWALFSYEGPKSEKVVLVGTGTGGVEEFVSNLNDNMIGYGLIRKEEQIDDSLTIKFAGIMWLGDNVPRMQKAKTSVHRGKMQEFIGHVHADIMANHKSEITDEILMQRFGEGSGTANKVLSEQDRQARIGQIKPPTGNATAKQAPINAKTTGSTSSVKVANIPKSPGENVIKYVDENAIRDAIKDVRNDSTPTNWVLVGYEGKKGNTLVLLGSGSGGLDEVYLRLEDDMVGYCLFRTTLRVDETDAVKFVFIEWKGENIDRMHKARLGTYSGAIKSLFAPFHVDFLEVTNKNELKMTTRFFEAYGKCQNGKERYHDDHLL